MYCHINTFAFSQKIEIKNGNSSLTINTDMQNFIPQVLSLCQQYNIKEIHLLGLTEQISGLEFLLRKSYLNTYNINDIRIEVNK